MFSRFVQSLSVGTLVLLCAASISACPECRARVSGGIYSQDFFFNFLAMLLPILMLILPALGFYFANGVKKKTKRKEKDGK